MKTFKKVLIIVLVLTVYFNIGYYYGKSWVDASVKSLNNEPSSFFQKAQLGGWKYWIVEDTNDSSSNSTAAILLSVSIWPFILILVGTTWIICAIVYGAIALWCGIVFLFKFIFCGGFFQLLGPAGSGLVIVFLVVILIARKFLPRK